MLPAHISRLHEWNKELQQEKKPEKLPEWLLEELQQTIEVAYQQQKSLTLTTFEMEKWHRFTGLIHHIDFQKKQILLTLNEGFRSIPFTTIQRAELDD